MKKVLLLARAQRLAPLFGETAKALAKNHQVFITLGLNKQPLKQEEARLGGQDPNIHTYSLTTEIKERYENFKKSGQDSKHFISEVEKELGLTLYQSASNYLTYRRFAYQYYGTFGRPYDQEDEYIEEFIGSYLFFKDVYESHSPDLVFCETPDQASHRIAAALAQKMNIFFTGIFLSSSFGKGRALLTSGTNRRSILLDHFYQHPELLSKEVLASSKELLKSYLETGILEQVYVNQLRKNTQVGPIKRLLKKNPRNLFSKKRNSSTLTKQLAIVRNIGWLEKHFKKELPTAPYILFSLHHQPEAATSMVAPHWIDQDKIIELLAMKAPMGLKIVVKENPKTYGLRGKQYFDFMTKFPNIHLLHPSVSQTAAIKNAEAVLAISGTVGLEGILTRKKVGVLSSCFYSTYRGVRVLQFPDEIFEHLKDPNWKPEENENDLLQFTAAAMQSTFFLGKPSLTHWPAPEEAGPNIAQGLQSFLTTIERAALNPSDFTIEM